MDSFLADVDRIAKRDYVPSDEDVMRARLRTLGVQEHKIHFNSGVSFLFCVGLDTVWLTNETFNCGY